MDIAYGFTAAGGFAAWIPTTNITAYAYPTSPNAEKAARSEPMVRRAIARKMIDSTITILPSYVQICGYEAMVETAERTYRALGHRS